MAAIMWGLSAVQLLRQTARFQSFESLRADGFMDFIHRPKTKILKLLEN
jgi:hypothetical protein